MKGVDAIAEILKREGTEFLFCYPRTPIIEACAKVGIRPILCRQERVGISMADGLSRASNGKKIGVFAMQAGPGTENAFPGVAQAYADNVPVLFLPGGLSLGRQGVRPNFQAVENFKHITKWVAQVNMVERIPEMMRRAFSLLRSGKPGPVMLEIPQEIWDADLARAIDYTPPKAALSRPGPAETRDAARLLLAARNPVIQAGQGVMYAEASEELVELSELMQLPVSTTMPGKSAFPENHPLSLGASSVATTKPVAHFMAKADLVLGLGTSMTRTPYSRFVPGGKTLIHQTNDETDLDKDYPAALGLIGDTKLALQDLIAEVKAQSNGVGKRNQEGPQREIASVRQEWFDQWMGQLTSNEQPINQYRVIWDTLRNVDQSKTIVTHDAGSPRDQVVPFWQSVAPRTYLGWGKTTQLGHGLGAIMGAKLARPDHLAINFMGDAAIGMVGMDIETASRNKIGTLTIVFNNGVMAIEKDSMPYAIEAYDAWKEEGNYAELARALGAAGARVERPEQYLPALRQAIAATRTGQPALIDVVVKEGYDFSRIP